MYSLGGVRIAAEGINVWNPSFDVTPSSLITGAITELGVAYAAADALDGIIDLATFLREKKVSETKLVTAVAPIAIPTGYRRFNENQIAEYVLAIPKLRNM